MSFVNENVLYPARGPPKGSDTTVGVMGGPNGCGPHGLAQLYLEPILVIGLQADGKMLALRALQYPGKPGDGLRVVGVKVSIAHVLIPVSVSG